MSHTYGNIDELKAFMTDGGANYGTTNDDRLLAVLEGSSRSVDAFAARSNYGSGFGPRVASNRYDAGSWTSSCLDLEDDFIAVTSVSVYSPPTASVATYSLVENTDYYLRPYGGSSFREIALHGYGAIAAFPWRSRIVVAGTAGYASELLAVTGTMGTVSASATTVIISGAGASVGATLRVDSEDLYITATTAGTAFNASGGTATVTRGMNGTTAAIHAAASAISVHQYPRNVKDVTLRVAQRRWRARDAGLTGDMGGGDIPSVGFRDTERSILRGIGDLKHYGAG